MYILGIDHGGTKTQAAICDYSGKILAKGESRGAYHVTQGMRVVMEVCSQAAENCFKLIGIKPNQVTAIVAGMTGADWPEQYIALTEALQEAFDNRNVRVENDVAIALRSGTTKKFGIGMCCGTGMNIAVVSPDGREFTFGDMVESADQGGSALANRVLADTIHMYTGFVKATPFGKAVLNAIGVADEIELTRRIIYDEGFVRKNYTKVTPLLMSYAEDGDEAALNIVDGYASRCARYLISGIKMFDMQNLDEDFEVVLTGGVFKGGRRFIEQIKKNINDEIKNAKIVRPKYEPVCGALLYGLDESDKYNAISEENFAESAAECGLFIA